MSFRPSQQHSALPIYAWYAHSGNHGSADSSVPRQRLVPRSGSPGSAALALELCAHARPRRARGGGQRGAARFVGLVLALKRAFRQLEIVWPLWALRLPGYAVGIAGAFWTLEHTTALFLPGG